MNINYKPYPFTVDEKMKRDLILQNYECEVLSRRKVGISFIIRLAVKNLLKKKNVSDYIIRKKIGDKKWKK